MNTAAQFKNYLEKHSGFSKASVKNYVVDLNHFIGWFEKSKGTAFNPALVTLEDLTKFREEKSSTLSEASLKRHLSSLKKYFHYLKMDGLISQSPLDDQSTRLGADQDVFRLKDFKNFLYVYNASPLTIKNYVIDVKQFLSWLSEIHPNERSSADLLLDKANSELVEEYKTRLMANANFSPSSVNRKLSSLRRYFSWANEQGIIKHYAPSEPTKRIISVPKQPVKAIPQASPRELGRLGKMLSLPIGVFDQIITVPLSYGAQKVRMTAWKLKGKPVFNYSQKDITPKIPRLMSHVLKISNVKKEFYAPSKMSIHGLPLHKQLAFHVRHTRPNWYKKHQNAPLAIYFQYAVLAIIIGSLALGFYTAFVKKPLNQNRALAAPTAPPRILSFQGRLTDNSDNPITSTQYVRFGIYADPSATGAGNLLWQEVDTVSPDTDGIFSILLGDGSSCSGQPLTIQESPCSIPASVFTDNSTLYLGVSIGTSAELTPRQRVATVAFATNSESLQGLVPTTQAGLTSFTNTVLALDGTAGSPTLTIGGSVGATFQATGGEFVLSGKPLTLTTQSNGNISINPDGLGKIDLQKPLQNNTNTGNVSTVPGAVEINDEFAILATSSGRSAVTINQGGAGPILSASASGTEKFTISNAGDVTLAGTTITASSLSTLTSAATLGLSSTTLNLGNGSAATIGTISNDNLSIIPQGTGALNLATTNTGNVAIGNGTGTVALTLGSDATGDIYYRNSGGVLTRLAVGSSGSVLTSTGTLPSWATSSGTGAIGYWTRTGTTLSPTNAGDSLSIAPTATTGNAISFSDTVLSPAAAASANLLNLAFTNAASNGSGTSITAGLNVAPTDSSAGPGGTIETYGIKIADMAGTSGAGSQTNYGIRIGNQGQSVPEFSYGLYVDAQSGAATQGYSAIFAGGNVGIGDTTPVSLFTVGASDAFQVNSSGAIVAATGITSSGTINFSGLTASRAVFTDASKNLVSTGASADLSNSLSDETGTGGVAVFSSSPSIASPTLTGTVNASGLTASRFVLTDASKNLVSSGLSSVLSDTLTDETGTGGVAVFSTSPAITTSITTGSTSFDLINTTATTVNFAGAATALNVGAASGAITLGSNSTLNGGSAANDDITIQGTSNATRTTSYVILQPTAGNVGIGDTSPASLFTVGSGDLFQVDSSGAIAAVTGYTQGSGNFSISGAGTFGTGTGAISLNGDTTIANAKNFVAGQTTGKIGFGGAVSGSDYLTSITGDSTQDWSRLIDITQANDSSESSTAFNVVNTINPGSITTDGMTFQNINSSLTPTMTLAAPSGTNITTVANTTQSLSLSSVTVGDNAGRSVGSFFGNDTTVTANPTINDTDTTGLPNTFNSVGQRITITGAPTISGGNVESVTMNAWGSYINNSVSSAGSSQLAYSSYGLYSLVSGDLTTTGTTAHTGGYLEVSGTAINNYGLLLNQVTSGTNNYGVYIGTVASGATNYALYSAAAAQSYIAGNLGIGDTSPAALFTVGSGDLFQVDSSGNTTLQNQADLRFGDADGSNYVAFQAPGTVGSNVTWTLPSADSSGCFQSNGAGTVSLASCGSGSGGAFADGTGASLGAIIANNSTEDLLVGGQATSSAKFAFINVNSGTPTASISGNLTLNSAGVIQTTLNQALTIGGDATGNITLSPQNAGSGSKILPGADNTVSLGSSPSARFKDLFLGPSSLHVQCTVGDGCGQGLDYALGVNTSTGTLSIGVNGTSAVGNPLINITQGGSIGIATTTPTDFKLQVAGDVGPNADDTYYLGSASKRWKGIYATDITVTNLIASTSDIAGTISNTFTINTDNATADAEDGTLAFERGSASPNATITWTSASDRFDLNSGINISSTIGNTTAIGVGTGFTNILDSATLDISGAGAITGATGIVSSGNIQFTGLTASRAVFTDASSNLATTGTSANLASSLSDEEGSGKAVFNDNPILLTAIQTSSTSFSLVNANATTVNLAGGATTALNVGSSTAATVNLPSLTASRFTLTDGSKNLISSAASSVLASTLTDETGSSGGVVVFSNAPSIASPTLSGTVNVSGLSASAGVYTDGSKNLTSTAPTSGTIGYWTRSGTTVSPATATDTVGIGSSNQLTVNSSGNLSTSGTIATTGTGTITSAGLLTASNGFTVTTGAVNITGTSGSIALTGFGTTSITSTTATGNVNSLIDNSLTSGILQSLSSTATGLTSGGLFAADWSPGSATTATGDLFSLNIGANGIIGNILNVKDNGSSVFSVSQAAVTANLPASFNAAGDVSVAYDINFTNPTASYIKSAAPLYMTSGETFNSSDLTLSTYNKGNVIVNSEAFSVNGSASVSASFAPVAASTAKLTDLSFTNASANTSGTSTTTGLNIAATNNAVGSGGTQETYGINIAAVAGTTGAGTQNIYGIRIGNQGLSNAENSYGLYVDAQSGSATSNYAAIFAGGNVGIGTTGPGVRLDMTGKLRIVPTGDITDNYNEGIRINDAANSYALLQLGGTGTSGTGVGQWTLLKNPSNNFEMRYNGSTLIGVASGGGVTFAGALSGITTISTSSTINSQTISSAANFTGSLTTAGNLSIGGVVTCIQGNCPTNNAIRLTPNLHLNSNAGNAVIVNWDGGTTGSTMTFRVGNGSSADAYDVYATGLSNQTGAIQVDGSTVIDDGAGWHRTYGQTGIYFSTYGIGLWPGDTARIDTYGSASIYANGGNLVASGCMAAGNGYNCGGYTLYSGSTLGVAGDSTLANIYATLFSGVGNGYVCRNSGNRFAFSSGTCGASSLRYKHDIADLNYGLDEIMQLRPVSFVYNEDPTAGGTRTTSRIGFIAEEMNNVVPEVVVKNGQGLIESIDYPNLTSLNTRGIQQMYTKIASMEADLSISNSGNLNILENNSDYFVTDNTGKTYSRISAFGEVITAKLRAGLVQAKKISTDSLSVATEQVNIAGKTLSQYISDIVDQRLASQGQGESGNVAKTDSISPFSASDSAKLAIKLKDNEGQSKLEVQNASGSAVASIDSTGKLTAEEIVAKQLTLEHGLEVKGDATISGVLRAQKIIADQIEGLTVSAASVSATYITNNYYGATGSATASPSGEFNASNSASLVSGSAIFENGVMAFGPSSLSDLTLTGQLAVGSQLVLADRSMNVLGGNLEIQSLGQGGVSFEGDLVSIDTAGNLTVKGNASFAKDVSIQGLLTANEIAPFYNKDLVIKLGGENATESGKFVIKNSSGSAVLSIDSTGNLTASGAAYFAKLNLEASVASPSSSTQAVATGSAGLALIKAGQIRVTINNPLVREDSLIYVTPKADTIFSGQPYIEQQVDGDSFTVRINRAIGADMPFNWVIIN